MTTRMIKNQVEIENTFALGTVTRPFGIKGQLTLYLYNQTSDALKPGVSLYFRKENSDKLIGPFILKSFAAHPKKQVIALNEIDHINDLEEKLGPLPLEVCMDRLEMPTLEEDEFYVQDLIGLEVRHFEDNRILGKVIDQYEIPGQTNLEIQLTDSATLEQIDDKVLDLPLIPSFLKDLDLESGIVRINLPEYL